MTLALTTRGYLCRGRAGGAGICGPGPVIVSAEAMTPDIISGAAELVPSPDIVGGGSLVPSISGDHPTPPTPDPDGPQIVGAGALTPQITGADEED